MSEYEMILEVGDMRIAGWVSGHVNWRVESLCGSFSLTSRASAEEMPAALGLGERCTLWVKSPAGKQKALVGVIDSIDHQITGDEVRTTVQGRSASADLVDCTAPLQAWRNQTALQIATDLCRHYDLEIADEAGLTELFADFASQPGETVVRTLTRLARLRGAWVGDAAPTGVLHFFIPGKTRVPYQLKLGEHLISARVHETRATRFSCMQVLGETPAGDLAQAEAEDAGAGQKRQHAFLAEEPALPDAMQARVNWERGMLLGESANALLEMQRWDALAGLLPVGGLVAVDAPQVGLVGNALVQGVSIFLDENGPRLEIGLTHRAAYQPNPSPSATAQPFIKRSA